MMRMRRAAVLLLASLACGDTKQAQVPAPPLPTTHPVNPKPRQLLHLAAKGMGYVVAVEGGPVLLASEGERVYAWDHEIGGFVERPDLREGLSTIAGGDMIGKLDEDMWFVAREPDEQNTLYRRRKQSPWQRVESWKARVDIQPWTPTSVLARIAPRKGGVRLAVFGEPPLPQTPVMHQATKPCAPDYENANIATFSNGAVLMGASCYLRWAPGATRGTVELGLEGALIAIGNEAETGERTTAAAWGIESATQASFIARWEGSSWNRVDTSTLGRSTIKRYGRTADGSLWVIAEPERGLPLLWRLAPGERTWKRVAWPPLKGDEQPGKNSLIDLLTVVDGELWIRAGHTPGVYGPFTAGIFTTRTTTGIVVL